MKPSDALSLHTDALRQLTQRRGFREPRIIASVLTDIDDSDLDILVETCPGTSLFTLVALEEAASHLLGVRVSIVPKRPSPACSNTPNACDVRAKVSGGFGDRDLRLRQAAPVTAARSETGRSLPPVGESHQPVFDGPSRLVTDGIEAALAQARSYRTEKQCD